MIHHLVIWPHLPASWETKIAAKATTPVNKEERSSMRTESHLPLANTMIYDWVWTSWNLWKKWSVNCDFFFFLLFFIKKKKLGSVSIYCSFLVIQQSTMFRLHSRLRCVSRSNHNHDIRGPRYIYSRNCKADYIQTLKKLISHSLSARLYLFCMLLSFIVDRKSITHL